MFALAIDTSGDAAGLALGREDVLIGELHFRHKMDLLRRLMPNVRSIVSDAGLRVSDVEGVVVSLGPGSFTGLRIGIATAKALAYALKKPIAGVPTLDVMAQGMAPHTGFVCPMIHAKPGEVYTALFSSDGLNFQKDITEIAAPVSEVVERLSVAGAENVLFLGDGARRNWSMLQEMGALAPTEHDFPRASVLLRMGIGRLQAGRADDVLALTPLYVRRPTPELRLECK